MNHGRKTGSAEGEDIVGSDAHLRNGQMDITASDADLTFLAMLDPLSLHALALRTITRSVQGYFLYFES